MTENKVVTTETKLSKKDVLRGWARYYTCAEVSSGFERLTAPAFSFGITPIISKLYGDNKEEMVNSLNRHLVFYNSEATWGSIIFGITCALEEERAKLLIHGATKKELDDSAEMIGSMKVGLMGPLAGVGDTINHGLLRPLLLSTFIPLAAAGSWVAGVCPLVIWGVAITYLAYYLVTKGYSLGRKSVVNVLQSGRLASFINVASVVGLFMMGALSASYVKLATAVSWVDAVGTTVNLQDSIDKIFPKLLPLLCVFGIYFYIKKNGPKYIRIILTILAASLILAFFGIL